MGAEGPFIPTQPRTSRDRYFALAKRIRDDAKDDAGFLEQVEAITKTVTTLRGGRKPTRADLAIATLWADDRRSTALATERATAAEQLAMHDPLTDTLNIRGFMEIAGHLLSVAQRNDIPATLAVIDFDDFKPVNDTFGHPVGDISLQEVAKYLNLRESDIVGRVGGDEFLVLLMGTTAEEAARTVFTWLQQDMPHEARRTIAERMREKLPEDYSDIEEEDIPLVSLSIGAADTTDGYLTIEQLRSRADDAVYLAKGRGKKRAVYVTNIDPNGDITYADTAAHQPFTMKSRRTIQRHSEESLS